MKHILGVVSGCALLAACATPLQVGERPKVTTSDVDAVTAVLQRDFHARGIAKMDRVQLDAVQRTCNIYKDNPPANVAKPLEQAQLKAIPYPAGSLMGDWKRGERIAKNGRGMTWRDKANAANGGGCYNCHQLSPKVEAYGTIGPSLKGFGKIRGSSRDIQQYAYGKIYNAEAYSLCSHMPRLGHSGTLNEQQIRDLTAYLLDPASPVNQ
jgi:sulfur-oxidizing protein SoxX